MRQKKKKINEILRTKSILRKRRRSKRKKKERNIQKNQSTGLKQAKVTRNKYTKRVENVSVDSGSQFTLFEKQDDFINLIKRLDKYLNVKSKIINLKINLSKVSKIDIGAVSFLLAKINELNRTRRINTWGDMPDNKECQQIFKESGFLEYMTDLSGNKFKKHSDNFMINVGEDRTKNERIGRTIEKSMKYLTGVERKFPPVYSVIQEVCSNSVEWANPVNSRNVNWLLAINYSTTNETKQINFTLTDIGYGILNTLQRNFGTIIKESATITNDIDILFNAFERKYGSKSGETNRNRGMPLVKKIFDNNYISNLKIVTNNVILDFEDMTLSKKINGNLKGTFYSWSVTAKNINIWEQQSK